MFRMPQHCDDCRTTTLFVTLEDRPYVFVTLDRRGRSLHIWIGPAGLHLFWPDALKSHADWCGDWREPVVACDEISA